VQLLYVSGLTALPGEFLETLRYLQNVFPLGIIGPRKSCGQQPETWRDGCSHRSHRGERFRGALGRHKAGVSHRTKFSAANAVASMTSSEL
jgi:hypothetical protein